MTTFQDREQAFEAKFAHDEEFRFLVTARRDKLIAQWAAERLRLPSQAGADLTASILGVRDGPGHDDRLLEHVERAFLDHGSNVQRTELAAALNQCATQAQRQLIEGSTATPGIF